MASWGDGDRASLVEWLRRSARSDPHRVLLECLGETITYAGASRQADRLAALLQQLGVAAGERVATLVDSSIDGPALWLGTNIAGAIHVPLNTRLSDEFLNRLLVDAEPAVLIVDHAYAPLVDGLDLAAAGVRTVILRGEPRSTLGGVGASDWADMERIPEPLPGPTPGPRDITCILYTSGTTGPSKGCLMSHNYMASMTKIYARIYGRTQDDVLWTALPLYHLAAMSQLAQTLMLAATMSIAPRFSVSGFWPEIQRTRASMVGLMGALLAMIAQAPDTPEMTACRGQIKFAMGSPFPPELKATWRDRFGVTSFGPGMYGMTEVSPIVARPDGELEPPAAAGKRHGLFDVRIVDDQDRELGPDGVGEVIVRPTQPLTMFSGYWRRPDAMAAATGDLWFRTGDLGKFDADGWFYFVDRKKDYIRRRGENISSFEVEQVVLQNPQVREVAAHAVASEFFDEEVKVTVIRIAGSTLTEAELHEWLAPRLPSFAVPRYIEFRDELPRNSVGRVMKYRLREEGVTATTWRAPQKARPTGG
jgi:crotonobetaine/carnitine-CoA ligase